jgi:thiol-disulfide isomerase/thioredoxin
MLRAWICGVAVLALVPAGWAQAAGEKGDKDKELKVSGELKNDDPFDKVREKSYCKTYKFKMTKDKKYQIDMKSKDVDSYLRLEDSGGKQLAFDDDGGGFPDARIVFTAPKDDTYVIICTTFGPGETGKFTLTAVPVTEKQEKLNQLKIDMEASFKKLVGEFQAAATEPEKTQAKDRLYAAAAEYVTKLHDFAEANAGDNSAADATKMRDDLLTALGQDESGIKALKQLATKATAKVIRGMAMVLVAGDGIRQYEKAYQKKDKAAAATLAGEVEAQLKQAKTQYGDVAFGDTTIGKQADNKIDQLRHRSLGKVAAEITGEDIDGKKFKLSAFKGKVVVLYFWGSWCPPCRAMIPDEKKLAARLEKAHFAMVGINTDQDRSKAKKFLEDEGITWTQVWDDGSTRGPISTTWNVFSFPTIYILDANGVIRYRDVRGAAMDNAVDELLKELPGGGK